VASTQSECRTSRHTVAPPTHITSKASKISAKTRKEGNLQLSSFPNGMGSILSSPQITDKPTEQETTRTDLRRSSGSRGRGSMIYGPRCCSSRRLRASLQFLGSPFMDIVLRRDGRVEAFTTLVRRLWL